MARERKALGIISAESEHILASSPEIGNASPLGLPPTLNRWRKIRPTRIWSEKSDPSRLTTPGARETRCLHVYKSSCGHRSQVSSHNGESSKIQFLILQHVSKPYNCLLWCHRWNRGHDPRRGLARKLHMSCLYVYSSSDVACGLLY